MLKHVHPYANNPLCRQLINWKIENKSQPGAMDPITFSWLPLGLLILNHFSLSCLRECPKPRSVHSLAQKRQQTLTGSSPSSLFCFPHICLFTPSWAHPGLPANCSLLSGKPFPVRPPLLRCCLPLVPSPGPSSAFGSLSLSSVPESELTSPSQASSDMTVGLPCALY